MLLTRAFPPLWDEKGMDYTLNLLDRMAGRLPCYELNFLPDKSIIDFVKKLDKQKNSPFEHPRFIKNKQKKFTSANYSGKV